MNAVPFARRSNPATLFARAGLLFLGIAVTWGCAAFGLKVAGKYVHPQGFSDPWGTCVAHWCLTEDVHVRSAGPDRVFNTHDDVTLE